MTPKELKAQYRNERLALRDALSPEERIEKSMAMADHAGETVAFEPGTIVSGFLPIRSEADLARLPSPLPVSKTGLMTIHLTSSCPFGEEARICAADSFGKVHGMDGLYVADASLLCTQPTVNPQGTIMAIARRNAMKFLGHL